MTALSVKRVTIVFQPIYQTEVPAQPMIELFPISEVNDAMEHLRAGKGRYRIALQNDIR